MEASVLQQKTFRHLAGPSNALIPKIVRSFNSNVSFSTLGATVVCWSIQPSRSPPLPLYISLHTRNCLWYISPQKMSPNKKQKCTSIPVMEVCLNFQNSEERSLPALIRPTNAIHIHTYTYTHTNTYIYIHIIYINIFIYLRVCTCCVYIFTHYNPILPFPVRNASCRKLPILLTGHGEWGDLTSACVCVCGMCRMCLNFDG